MGALLLIFILHAAWFVLAGALIIGGLAAIVIGVLELVRRRALHLPSRHARYSESVPVEDAPAEADFEDREQWADGRLVEDSASGGTPAPAPAAGGDHPGRAAAPPRWRGYVLIVAGVLAGAGGVILFVQTVANLSR